ncbi:MAG: hypothetical protein LBT65_08580 [Synergistaceae bacterium]|jgi:hypothetical protein|nr:hypothetical protein [Synergistaceae bacterium]
MMPEENTSGLRAGWALRVALFWCLLICVFFGLVSTAPLWPKGRLDEHLKGASRLLNKEGAYWMPFGQMPVLSNFTDAIMLNIVGTLDSEEPVRSAMRMSVSYTPDDRDPGNPPYDLKNMVEGRAAAKSNYARYWHGYAAILRPLLSVIGFSDVRKISFFLSTLLFSMTLLLLCRRTGWKVALGFAIAMIGADFPLSAFCMAYSGVFLVVLAATCIILYWNVRDEERLLFLFLLWGSLAAFIDFLTVPVVTCLLPLFAMIFSDLHQEAFRWNWPYTRRIVRLGMAWAAGYLLTWAAKWVLADVVLGEGVIQNALHQIFYRMGGAEKFTLFDRFLAVAKNIYMLAPFSTVPDDFAARQALHQIIFDAAHTEGLAFFETLTLLIKEVCALLPASVIWGLFLAALTVLVYIALLVPMIMFSEKRWCLGALGYLSLAVLFLVPYLWLFVTANHAFVHCVFTFRNQIPSVWLFLILPHIMKKKT